MNRTEMQERIEYLESLRRIQSEQVRTMEETVQKLKEDINRLKEDITRLHLENSQQLHFLILTTKRHEQLTMLYEHLQRRNRQLTDYTERLRDCIENTNPNALMVWSDDTRAMSDEEESKCDDEDLKCDDEDLKCDDEDLKCDDKPVTPRGDG
jgi:DNA repair exonuclease SbcCD ATPase subunit